MGYYKERFFEKEFVQQQLVQQLDDPVHHSGKEQADDFSGARRQSAADVAAAGFVTSVVFTHVDSVVQLYHPSVFVPVCFQWCHHALLLLRYHRGVWFLEDRVWKTQSVPPIHCHPQLLQHCNTIFFIWPFFTFGTPYWEIQFCCKIFHFFFPCCHFFYIQYSCSYH